MINLERSVDAAVEECIVETDVVRNCSLPSKVWIWHDRLSTYCSGSPPCVAHRDPLGLVGLEEER